MSYAENIIICIAVPLIISMFFLHGSNRRFVAAFLVGMGTCLLSAYISGFINIAADFGEKNTSVFISPIIEEVMKILPILFVFFLFTPKDRELVIIAAGIGAGFATFENCCHILISGADSLPYVLIRGVAVGVMHIVSVLIIAMTFVIQSHWKMLSIAGVLGALGISMSFHALYNLLVSEPGISSYIGYAVPIITAAALLVPFNKLFKITID